MPLIVPPVKEKQYDFFGPLFTTIWQKAEDALASAKNIVVIGYSFPRTDHRSVALFKSAFLRRSALPRVRIVDPNPEPVADRFRSEFGIPDSHLTVFKDYFSESFDLDRLFN